MQIVYPNSIGRTLDALNETLLSGRTLRTEERQEAVRFIAGRQGLPGAYRGMPAPTAEDIEQGARFFTGERISSRAGISHILGEEACRALMLLGPLPADAQAALERAQAWLRVPELATCGHYCCYTCSPALWRHLATRPWPEAVVALTDGLRRLQSRRYDGEWKSYPFWYTVLALTDIGIPAAIEELRYVAPKMERTVHGAHRAGVHAQRRRVVAERALSMI